MKDNVAEVNRIMRERYVKDEGDYYTCTECQMQIYIGDNMADFFRHERNYHSSDE